MSHHHHHSRGLQPPAAGVDDDDHHHHHGGGGGVIVRQTLSYSSSSSPSSSPPFSGSKNAHKNSSTTKPIMMMMISNKSNNGHDHDHDHERSSFKNLAAKNDQKIFVKKNFSSSHSLSADQQQQLVVLISNGAEQTVAEPPAAADEDRRGGSNGHSFWRRHSMATAVFILFTLLFGTFSLVNAFSSRDSEGSGTADALVGEDDDAITQLITDDDAKGYLNRYGYIDTTIPSSQKNSGAGDEPRVYAQQQQQQQQRNPQNFVGELTLDSIRSAVRKFQQFAGLPTTGDLDNQTKKKMTQPRCGIQDVQMLTSGGDYVMKWRKRRVTYQLMQSTSDLPERMQKQAIQMAFDTWSKIVPLDFAAASGYDTPDVKVLFARRSHGDPWPFDGRGGVLAHATFPQDGKLHFDDDENWVFMDGRKIGNHRFTDLYWVALHEIGHVLGLSHSKIETAIMAPFYQDPRDLVDWRGNYKRPELTQDDVRAAQQIYGKRYGRFGGDSTSSTSSERSRERTAPTSSAAGGGRRKSNGGSGGTYDDSEGGFWSRFGKLFSTEDNNNDDDNNHDRHHTQHGRRTHTRRDQQQHHRHNYVKEFVEMDNSATTRRQIAKFNLTTFVLASFVSIVGMARLSSLLLLCI